MSMQIATEGPLLHGIIHVTVNGIDKLPSGWRMSLHGNCSAEGLLITGKRFIKYIARMLLCRTVIFIASAGFLIYQSLWACFVTKTGSYRYATVDLDRVRVARTGTIEGQDASPHWGESFRVYCAHQVKNVVFTVKENDPVAATLIGRAYVSVLLENLTNGEKVEKWVDIVDETKNPIPGNSKIHVSIQYINVVNDPDIRWSRGIPGQQFRGVPKTYFMQNEHCRVTLYQDAHVADSFNIRIPLSGGKYYEPHKCWEDIFEAISNARHFIYITGWSVFTKITLVRDPRKPSVTLGELLVQKADSGVTVLMLVWDDESSIDVDILGKDGLMKTSGLMGTHDENTATFFKNTKVHCVLCPRNILMSTKQKAAMQALKPLSMMQRVQNYTMFTHHQKSIILDFPEFYGSEKRRIVSFIGGIDLCDGRYDTQDHPLFSSLNTIHHDDFHQPNFPGADIKKGGPREPWHDIHCKIEGPAAFDVMKNFEQRWTLQGGGDPQLLGRNKFEPSPVPYLEQSETWNVQIFRSIDGVAAAGFPEDSKEAREKGLATEKEKVIDRSIQDAYINAIRRAKNFIYIENQYFIGSSYAWKSSKEDQDIGSWNLIPKELSLKIVSKINSGERFTVYVVIPMWPEGVPESKSVQAILNWQKRTMEMMYTDVAHALRRRNLDTDPREYLTFLCLGNRETEKPGEFQPSERPEAGSDYCKAQQTRRFMIYVHSKMMIVDDEYIIIGSANINQRSMDGSRDTEIAMGAYQPYHLATTNRPARGQIYGFRMSLWREHLGLLEAYFENPASRECMLRVNEITDQNWRAYSSNSIDRDLSCHLLRYPINVEYSGEVTFMSYFKLFPDTNAEILGKGAFDYPFPLLTS